MAGSWHKIIYAELQRHRRGDDGAARFFLAEFALIDSRILGRDYAVNVLAQAHHFQ
jgi:hypothetical protein